MRCSEHAYKDRVWTDNGIWITSYIRICPGCGDIKGYLVANENATEYILTEETPT